MGSLPRKIASLTALSWASLEHDGYVGGWYNSDDGRFYFDSTRIFPEDQLKEAIKFGKENGQYAIFILSTGTEVSLLD